MCGIFAYIGTSIDCSIIQNAYLKTANRGPDNHEIKSISNNLIFGFHRLAINDISFKGMQPLHHPHKPYWIICNGEIYNSKQLIKDNNFKLYSNSDCEVIIHLYEKYGINKLLTMIDSEAFAFCLYDGITNELFVARDRFGVRPLFIGKTTNNEILIASEMKNISMISNCTISQFTPGCWKKYSLFNLHESDYKSYYDYIFPTIKNNNINNICYNIKNKLTDAVIKRLMSDRPIGCMLSGGLDSSLISAIVAKEIKKISSIKLKTFSIGLKGSTDLFYAKKVADFIGSEHHSIELEEKDFLNAIPEVIYNIESYDTTTVRASVGNYLLGKYIKENTDITVLFNGDGSDEQSGYLYMENAPNEIEFKNECIRLLKEIHYYDALRSDRAVSSKWSLETRTPFLDTNFVNYYMSIDSKFKMYSKEQNNNIFNEKIFEKHLLRLSFAEDKLIPNEVLWRRKEAFSDGCSSNERSWHKIIKEFIDNKITDETFEKEKYKFTYNIPQMKETLYYRNIFEKYYKGRGNIIPHLWVPKWTNIIDPSARELDNY
jgi:asparagine synthase (glutamine-hydrolysing)